LEKEAKEAKESHHNVRGMQAERGALGAKTFKNVSESGGSREKWRAVKKKCEEESKKSNARKSRTAGGE